MAPIVHSPHPKWQKRHSMKPPPHKTKLSDSDLKTLARKMMEKYGWESEPRPFQLAGVQAQLEGTDMIIQAPTGFGKTAIAAGPHLWPSSKGKITLVISPLLALEEEMVETFRTDFGLQAIAVNSNNGGCSWSMAKVSYTISPRHCYTYPLFHKIF